MKFLPQVTAVVAIVVTAVSWFRSFPRRRNRRGRRLLANRWRRMEAVPGVISWGGVQLPAGAENSHFLVVGTTGSGKSLTLGRLMREALEGTGTGEDKRALIYDAKTDVASFLATLSLAIPVVYLNPFDKRSSQWDMSADITSPASALQVASIFVPEESGSSNRYFTDTARDLLREVMMSFVSAGCEWTLRDIMLAMRSKERLREVLERTPEGAELLTLHTGDSRAFQSVLSTARSRLAPLEPIAALWHRAKEKVSLRDWVRGGMVLVLGNDESARTAMDALNQVVFQRATELALKQPNSTTRRTWFFLDEVREAGKLAGLSKLMNKGRSRGCCVALGFQDIHGLKDVYGTEVALEIVGQCSQKALLRMESEATAKWGSATIGQYEHVDVLRGRSGWQLSAAEQWRTADLVMPSELLGIAPTSMTRGLTGYYLTPHIGAFRRTLPLLHMLGQPASQLDAGAQGEQDFIERPECEQYLASWSVEDCNRLGLAHETPISGSGVSAPHLRTRTTPEHLAEEQEAPRPKRFGDPRRVPELCEQRAHLSNPISRLEPEE